MLSGRQREPGRSTLEGLASLLEKVQDFGPRGIVLGLEIP
jgi:hypothetical protein